MSKVQKNDAFDSIFPTFHSGNTPRPTLATWYRFCACPDFVKSDFFKQSLWNIEYSGRSEFLFPRRCLIFLQFLRIWFNSVDSHFFVPNLKLPVFGPQKVRENLSPFKQYFRMQTSPISMKTNNNMIENRPKNILCITIYRSNKVLYRQIRLAFAYIPEVDNLWKQKKNPSEGFNSPRSPARASSPSAHRLFRYSIVCFGDTWRQASDILTSRVRNMHALVGARRNFCNVILSSDSLCVPVVKRVDPTLTVTDKEANIGHLQFSDIVLCRFVRCFSSRAFHCQFQPGNGYGIVTQKCYWRNWQIINILTCSVTYMYNQHGHRFTT